MSESILEIKNVNMSYRIDSNDLFRGKYVLPVLKDVSLNVEKGKVVGLVGESGCGKSTLGKCILDLEKIDSGQILFEGENIHNFNKKELKQYRKNAQLIFQNPYSSLNPRMTIYDTLSEPLIIHNVCEKKDLIDRVENMLDLVGLKKEDKNKYPHEFSGGQRQRIAIARAIITMPKFIVADEPVSALDVSIQAQIINLLIELKEKFDLTILFISHDLNVVKYLCDEVAIMERGKIAEKGTCSEIFVNPKSDYTKTLLNAILKIN